MKMKYLKAFENFSNLDFGRFSEEEDQLNNKPINHFEDDEFETDEYDDEYNDAIEDELNDEYEDEYNDAIKDERSEIQHVKSFNDFDSGCKTCGCQNCEDEEPLEDDEEEKHWGDELVESRKRKTNKDLVKDVKKIVKKLSESKQKEDKCSCGCGEDKCDDDKCKCNEKKPKSGLTKAQEKKLPEGLKKAIEAKNKKK